MLAFSFSGRLDFLDWVFYWGDITSRLMLPPLFVHFALVFPERPDSWVRSDAGRRLLPLLYLPALLLGRRRKSRWSCAAASQGAVLSTRRRRSSSAASCVYLAVSLVGGLGDHDPRAAARLLGHGAPAAALDRLGHGARRGAVRPRLRRCRSRSASRRSSPFEFTAVLLGLVPLAFASAIIRYRLMDVEVIIKRALVYCRGDGGDCGDLRDPPQARRPVLPARPGSAAIPIIALLATIVVVLLSRPVKNAIQTGLDRVYYRDRYDYRRALVGFARDLNSDLDLLRLSERLVRRVTETLRRRSHGADAGAGGRRAGRQLRHDRARRLRPRAAAAAARRRTSRRRLIAGPHADARRSARAAPPRRARSRLLARGRDPLLRPVRLEGRDDRGDGARAARRAPSR